MTQGKYFVQPLLAQLLQKRENGGPAGLTYLPEISDVTNIPDGVNYFYFSGEDHDQYINGYIYKRVEQRETVQVWDIITPAVTEHQSKLLPAGTLYIDVLAEGFNRPVGRYYRVKLIEETINFEYDTLGSTPYRSSFADMLGEGDFVWDDTQKYEIASNEIWRITLKNGTRILRDGTKGYGSVNQEWAYYREDGEILYFASANSAAGVGIVREYYGQKYLLCDGLYAIPGTAEQGRTTEPFTYEFEVIITPAVWGWVEKEVITTTWKQHDAQPRGVARIESTDGTKYVLVENSGTTIAGDVTALNNVTVKGNLYVEGTEVVTDVETVQSEDDFIKLRFNNPAALSEGQSGLQVLNFDGNGAVMYLVVGGDGILRLGLGNELEPVTTRDEAAQMIDGAVTVWNAQAQKIKTGPAASKLVQSDDIKTLKALSLADYNAITTKDIYTAYLII